MILKNPNSKEHQWNNLLVGCNHLCSHFMANKLCNKKVQSAVARSSPVGLREHWEDTKSTAAAFKMIQKSSSWSNVWRSGYYLLVLKTSRNINPWPVDKTRDAALTQISLLISIHRPRRKARGHHWEKAMLLTCLLLNHHHHRHNCHHNCHHHHHHHNW